LNPDLHLQTLQESFETLRECVDIGIEKKQRTIGFHTSLASVEMLELYLHKIGVLSLSARLNHAWMKSQKKIKDKITHDFPRKEEIIQLIYYIEKNRDALCYGKLTDRAKIREQLDYFYRLVDAFKEVGLSEIP